MFTTAPRQQLHNLLENICPNVYFQPPEEMIMVYPCIVYELTRGDTKFADNKPFLHTRSYQIKLIARDPDSDLYGKLAGLPRTIHERFYAASGLNHNVFSIHF